MAALLQWFEVPLAEHKAQTQMETITQDRGSVAVNTQEFQELVCQLATWPEDQGLIHCFKDGLNNDVYHTCISCVDAPYITGMCWQMR